jgi:membrane protein|nr:MAG TPA: hypothetical protein [Caudoviricetes sp.]
MNKVFKLLKLDQYPEVVAYLTVMAMVSDLAFGFMLTVMGKLINIVYPVVFLVLMKLISNLTHVVAITPLYKRLSALGAFKASVWTTAIAMVSSIMILFQETRMAGVTLYVLGSFVHSPVLSVFKNKTSAVVASYQNQGFDIGSYQNHREVLMCITGIIVSVVATIMLLPSLFILDLSKEVQMLNEYDMILLRISIVIGIAYVAFRAYVVRKIGKYLVDKQTAKQQKE